jgi:hypothetical protein
MVAALVVGLASVVSRAQAFEPQGTAAGLKEPEMGVMVATNEMVMSPMSQITAQHVSERSRSPLEDKIVVRMVDQLPKDNMRKTFLLF